MERPFGKALEILRSVGLRPTRQRMALCKLLFGGTDQHVSAENLHALAKAANVRVSLATVYNTLHQFKEAGLLCEVVVEPGRSYFDTNMTKHHHFFDYERGDLIDIPEEQVVVHGLPVAPDGCQIDDVDIVIRISRNSNASL